MTDLNLFIANVLEPKPSHKTAPRQIAPGSPSVNGGWQCPGWTEAGGYIWQPRDFRADPAAILMLMEQPGFISLDGDYGDSEYYASFCGAEKHDLNCYDKIVSAKNADLKLAVCLAFGKAHGYVEESHG